MKTVLENLRISESCFCSLNLVFFVLSMFFRTKKKGIKHVFSMFSFSLPCPFRAYPKENPVLLGREYLNRTNRPVDIFALEQNN